MNNAFCRNNLTLKYFDSKIKLCVMKAMEKKTLQRQIYSIRMLSKTGWISCFFQRLSLFDDDRSLHE